MSVAASEAAPATPPVPPEAEESARQAAAIENARNFARNQFENGVDIAKATFSEASVAMSSIGGFVARKRMERAGSTMERMDHKEALYQHLGAIAAEGGIVVRTKKGKEIDPLDTGVTHLGETPVARTVVERAVDRAIDRSAQKMQKARDDRYESIKRYGVDEEGNPKNFGHESKRSINRRVRNATKQARRAGKSAAEVRQIGAIERGKRVNGETKGQRETRERLHKTTGSVTRLVEHKPIRAWREGRQERAIGRIKTNYHRMQAFEEAKDRKKTKRAQQKAAKQARAKARRN